MINVLTEGTTGVTLIGCPSGIDVFVEHCPGGNVRLTRGQTGYEISVEDWRDAVLDFARQVEALYSSSSPKAPPQWEDEQEGWEQFWCEWRALVAKHGALAQSRGTARP